MQASSWVQRETRWDVKGHGLVLWMAVNCAHRLCKACFAFHWAEQHGGDRRLALVFPIPWPAAPCAAELWHIPRLSAGCWGCCLLGLVFREWLLTHGRSLVGAALLGLGFLFSLMSPVIATAAARWLFVSSTPLEGNVIWRGEESQPRR